MAELIKLEEIVVDRDAEILEIAIDYHKELCGCKNFEDELAPYIERVTVHYDKGEFNV